MIGPVPELRPAPRRPERRGADDSGDGPERASPAATEPEDVSAMIRGGRRVREKSPLDDRPRARPPASTLRPDSPPPCRRRWNAAKGAGPAASEPEERSAMLVVVGEVRAGSSLDDDRPRARAPASPRRADGETLAAERAGPAGPVPEVEVSTGNGAGSSS